MGEIPNSAGGSTTPTSPLHIARVSLVATTFGVVIAIFGWYIWIAPARAINARRFEANKCMLRLYDLQVAYGRTHGQFASDLEGLLKLAPDANSLRQALSNSTDVNSITVVGDSRRFRLEANILDPERTLIKIVGPL